MLHTTPVMDCIGFTKIAKETESDPTLSKIKEYVWKNQNWIPKSDPTELQKFQGILPEISVSGNGILLKNERCVSKIVRNKTKVVIAIWMQQIMQVILVQQTMRTTKNIICRMNNKSLFDDRSKTANQIQNTVIELHKL